MPLPAGQRGRAALLIGAQTVILLLLFWRGSWYADDFQSMAQAQRAGFDRAYLDREVFGHPMPGMRALDWVLVRAAPLNYHVVAVISACCLGLSSWLLFCVLRRLFRPEPWLLVLAAVPGFSAIWLPPVLWWASATEMLGSAISTTLCCYLLVRCVQAGGWVPRLFWGVGAGLALGFGLLFYERSLIGAAFAGLLVPAACASGLRGVRAVLRRAWPGYLSIGLVGAGYLRYYFSHGHVRQHSGFSVASLLEYLWRSWAHTLIPGLFGGPLRWQFVSNIYGVRPAQERFLNVYAKVAPPGWWVLLTELALLLIAGLGLRRNGIRSLRGWLILLPIFVLAQYTIATARLAGYGPGIGDEPRYVSDLLPAAVLSLALVVLRPRGSVRVEPGGAAEPGVAAEPADPAGVPARRRGRRLSPALAALVACGLVFAASAIPVSVRWSGNRSSSYLANLRRSLHAADARGPWSLYDTPVPNWLVPASFVPYNRMSMLAPLVHPSGVSMDDASRSLLVVTGDGTAVPARFAAAATFGRRCATDVASGIVFTLNRSLAKGWWFLQVDYDAPQPARLSFVLDAGRGFVIATGDSRLVQGSGRLVVAFLQAPLVRVGIRTSSAALCLRRTVVGQPEAVPR
ncbi:MAG TPA: hypothetical protein VHO01_08195 [Jatrophihabitans sp.]|nr:hypothetical protein [Jatrophihabitans sp.]